MRSRRALVTAVGASLLLLTGCLNLSSFDARESHTSVATFKGLADGGGFVVVSSTGASETVPGAGWWRVDRSTGAAVALPGEVKRLAPDGATALLADGSLWHEDGTVATDPGVYSEDLRFRFVESGGVLEVHAVDTGAVTSVDAVHPRPVGTTAVFPRAVSDDGRTVHYRATVGSSTIERFADLDSPTPVDLPRDTEHLTYAFSADGSTLARSDVEVQYFDTEIGPLPFEVGVQLDLIDVSTGAVLASQTLDFPEPTTYARHTSFEILGLSDNGRRVWTAEVHHVTDREGTCAGGPTPIPIHCVTATLIGSLDVAGVTNEVNLGPIEVRAFDQTRNGVFAAISAEDTRSVMVGLNVSRPPLLLHASHGQWGQLVQGPTEQSTDWRACLLATGSSATPCDVPIVGTGVELSDDGTVAGGKSMKGRGWYDYSQPG